MFTNVSGGYVTPNGNFVGSNGSSGFVTPNGNVVITSGIPLNTPPPSKPPPRR